MLVSRETFLPSLQEMGKSCLHWYYFQFCFLSGKRSQWRYHICCWLDFSVIFLLNLRSLKPIGHLCNTHSFLPGHSAKTCNVVWAQFTVATSFSKLHFWFLIKIWALNLQFQIFLKNEITKQQIFMSLCAWFGRTSSIYLQTLKIF